MRICFTLPTMQKQITVEGINEKIRQVGKEQKMPYEPRVVKPDKSPITFELKP